MTRQLQATYFSPTGTEGRRTVSAAEAAPSTAAHGVDCEGFRWAYIRVDGHSSVTSGTLAIYLAADDTDVPQLYQTSALSASASTDIAVNVAAVSTVSARITELTGTSVRVTVRLAVTGPTS